MDAKVDDWVVTPRRGKAVEINALWFNALQLMEQWAEEQGDPAAADYRRAGRAGRRSRSTSASGTRAAGICTTSSTRKRAAPGASTRNAGPIRSLASRLPHPVLARERWEPVVDTVRDRLLTPVGLRSLAPGDPDYKSRYFGDLRARDAAYHQGTVWAWLVGPFVDAWLKVYPEDHAGARRAVEGFVQHLDEACIGSISEVFDAEAPFTPRGCIAQAWSVAEVLRVWVKLQSHRAVTGAAQSDGDAMIHQIFPLSCRKALRSRFSGERSGVVAAWYSRSSRRSSICSGVGRGVRSS